MFYYQFNIGDYVKATQHLTMEEDIAYRRLLDLYYDTERPIPNDIPLLSRRLRVGCQALEVVLKDFFVVTEEGWRNTRADREIKEYHDYKARQAANGKKGGRPRRSEAYPTENPPLTQAKPKKSLTTNHKPITNKKEREEALLKPEDVSEQVWEDFLKVRKEKKAVVTVTVMNRFKEEAAKAGVTLEKAISYAVEKNWQGFRADWYLDREGKKPEEPWYNARRRS